MKKFLSLVLQGALSAVIGLFFVYMVTEWASGCGETYVDAKGVTYIGECILIQTKKGTN
jgi:hypothetical protein